MIFNSTKFISRASSQNYIYLILAAGANCGVRILINSKPTVANNISFLSNQLLKQY